MADILNATKQDWAERSTSTVDKPTGTVEGTGLLWFITGYLVGVDPAIPDPVGFELVGSSNIRTYAAFNARIRMFVFKKLAGASEPLNYQVTHPLMYTSSELVAISGPNVASLLDVPILFSDGTTSSAGTTVNAPAVTTVNANTRILTARSCWDGVAVSPTATWTEHVDHPSGYIQSFLQTAAGAIGPVAIPSGNSAGAGKPFITATVPLRHASATPPPPYEPQWLTALADAAAGEGQARMMLVFNSMGEGEGVDARDKRWWSQLTVLLRSFLGIAGSGRGHLPMRYHTYEPISAPWRTPAVNSPALAAKTFARAAGSTSQFTFTGTGFTVLYNGAPGLGTISVSVDGGTAEVIPAQTTGVARRWHKEGLSAGTHTVLLTANTGGAQIVGIEPYNGDGPNAGLSYLDMSWSGATTTQFLPGGPYDVSNVMYNPHFVMDGKIGANDHLNDLITPGSGIPPEVAATRFRNRVAVYRSYPSRPDTGLFVLPYLPAGSDFDESAVNSFGAVFDDYREACIEVAEELDCHVFDIRQYITLSLSDLAPDNLHVGESGQLLIAQGLVGPMLEASGYTPPAMAWGDTNITGLAWGDNVLTGMAQGDTILW